MFPICQDVKHFVDKILINHWWEWSLQDSPQRKTGWDTQRVPARYLANLLRVGDLHLRYKSSFWTPDVHFLDEMSSIDFT
jgi:hypothetical protein